MITIVGMGASDKRLSTTQRNSSALFNAPHSVCIDPLQPSNFYVSDQSTIRYVDSMSGTVRVVAGSRTKGFADGSALSVAQFRFPIAMVCTSDGERLYVCDAANNRLRLFNTKTQVVSTAAGDGDANTLYTPTGLAFDRSFGGKPESALFVSSRVGIRRFYTRTETLRACPALTNRLIAFTPGSIDCTPSGELIAVSGSSLQLFNPTTGVIRPLEFISSPLPVHTSAAAGSALPVPAPVAEVKASKIIPRGVVVVDSERCAFITCGDTGRPCVRRITLPDTLFVAPQH